MLFEDTVIDAVIVHLENNGYRIIQRNTASQQGYDLVAEKNGKNLYVEAKGQTSSKPGTKRYGKEFNSGQKFDHVAKAVLKAIQALNQDIGSESGIALPKDPGHVKLVESILPSLRKIGLRIFLVDEDLKVFEK
ncbi:hypothetical protein ACFL0D_07345 [Thermoproteota archaeon]